MSAEMEADETKSDASESVSLSDDDTKDMKLKDRKEKIFIEFMTYSNEYIKLRHQLHVNLARGHLNMARGTRSTFSKSPGKFKNNKNIFNKEMQPIATLSQSKQGTFHLEERRSKNKTSATAASSMLRQRTAKQSKTTESMEETKNNDANEDKIVDPISWYGAMVPRPVTLAQTDFKNSLNVLVEMANVKQRLNHLNAKWDQLQQQ